MKNMNGGYGNSGGVSMLTRSYHSETSSSNNRGRAHDLVNGNYSTTINVAHNKNNSNGVVGGASGGRGEMNANGGGGGWRGSQECLDSSVKLI